MSMLGIVLVFAFLILAMLYTAFTEEERDRRESLVKSLQSLSAQRTAAEEADRLLDDFFRRLETLTRTERDVFRHLAAGKTNTEIQDLMYISVSTIKKHNTHIFAKLGVSSRDDLSLYVSLARNSGKFEYFT
jgi:DNA-binding CsgD family transcriptional regulator